MTTVISQEIRAEIIERVGDATSKSPAELDAIACDYALTLKELGGLIDASERMKARTGQTITQKQLAAAPGLPAKQASSETPRQPAPPSRPAAEVSEPVTEPGESPSKPCTACGETKALTEFYAQETARDGRGSQCRACNDRRDPNAAKLIRNRARNRATKILIERNRVLFEVLLGEELNKAIDEHQRLVAEAAAKGQSDAEVARLKPGPKRAEQTDVIERLDIARCSICHTHHDDQHVCPSCGDETPATSDRVKPYVIRDWARREGLAPVPTRGPLPERITAAYLAAHPEIQTNQPQEANAS